MIDTHAHLNFNSSGSSWKKVIKNSLTQGVEKIITVGTDIDSSEKSVEMAQQTSILYASVGIHPHHVKNIKSKGEIADLISNLRNLAKRKKVVAIGEIGLDYHYYKDSKYHNTIVTPQQISLQKQLLVAQIKLAKKLKLPLIIHSREAKNDVLDIILKTNPGIKGVFHCFDGSKKYAKKILDASFYISFTGNITYNQDRANVAKLVPLNHLLLETDSPFMLPEPKRTKYKKLDKPLRSEPSDVKIIGSFHAKQRDVLVNKVYNQTTDNAIKLFKFE